MVWERLLGEMSSAASELRSRGEFEQAVALEKDALYIRGRALRHLVSLKNEAANDVQLKRA